MFLLSPDALIRKIVEKVRNYEPKKLHLEGFKESAVLIPVVENGSLIFIKRSENLKDHKGQVAFPGGVIEEVDTSPIDTALREAEEELGLNSENVKPINFIDDTITIAGYLIHPLVGLVKENIKLFPNPYEVDEVYIIPIKDIVSSRIEEDKDRMSWKFYVNDIVIWGATARILKNFLDICELM